MTIDASLNKRLDRVIRTHARMRRNGVIHRVGRDGLIRTRPRLVRPRFPMKGAAIIVGLLLAFKVLMFAQMGAETYALRVEGLRNGSFVEQTGAVIMQEDRVTVALGEVLRQHVFQR